MSQALSWELSSDPHFCDQGCKDANGERLWAYYNLAIAGWPAGSYCGPCATYIQEHWEMAQEAEA